jgi:hypothetical protein
VASSTAAPFSSMPMTANARGASVSAMPPTPA